MRRFLFAVCLFAFCAVSCDPDEPSDVVVLATDSEGMAYVQAGKKLLIRVQSLSDNYLVERIRISSIDAEKGTQLLKDTLLGGVKRSDFYFQFTVPSYFLTDTAQLTLAFEGFASNGGTSKMVLIYRVVGGASLISYDGIIMYGARSGRPDGFSLAKAQTIDCDTEDSSNIDMYDYYDILSADTTGRLSREWRSRTGLQFARMNDFDFSGTNQLLLNNAFRSSRRYTSLKDISEGDVVLFGRGEDALGVLQLLMVADEAGTANDRYVFNLKLNKQVPVPSDTTTTDTTRRFRR